MFMFFCFLPEIALAIETITSKDKDRYFACFSLMCCARWFSWCCRVCVLFGLLGIVAFV